MYRSHFTRLKFVPGPLVRLQAEKDEIGFVLSRVQEGKGHNAIKSLTGFPAVYEIRSDVGSEAYRVVYVVDLPEEVTFCTLSKRSPKRESEPHGTKSR